MRRWHSTSWRSGLKDVPVGSSEIRVYTAARIGQPYGRCQPSSTPSANHCQQYLAKNPGGYCGLGGTGVSCPIGLATD